VVTASIGVAVAGASRPDELLRDADTAMYHAKDQGRARFEMFDDALRARVVDRHQTERDLRRALAGRELVFRYQPVVALETGRPVGFEALLRWEHPVRGLLPPADFLGVAEETGLMSRVGAVARAGAFRQWAQWRNDHPEWGHFLMAVNLAAGELRDRSLPGAMGALLGDLGVDPRCIVIEVTEQVLAGDTEVLHEVLTELRALGVLLALDDFGTGSSPLLHLRGFPINAIKLDGALVAGLGIDRDDDVIAAAVVDLAHRLGHFVVAEGVEEPRQAARLRAIGCRLAQGHAFAPALTAAEAEAWAVAHHVGPLPGAPTR
jgi:EAL domain-containing protein (putative c-di-GMP-specific phosphodiesterase class I)